MTLKITISDLAAKQLRDTGSLLDPQDPSVTLKIGKSLYSTNRQKDAGVNASYPEIFTFEIDPTIINNENFLEVEVWNISEPGRNSVIGTKNILVGRGKVTLFNLLNEIKDGKKAISIKLSFPIKFSNAKVGTTNDEAGMVVFQLRQETSSATDHVIESKIGNDGSDELGGHKSSVRDWNRLDEKPSDVNSVNSGESASMDITQQPLKITIYDLKAKQLRDTGSVNDPQDPSVTLKFGTNSLYSTTRQRDAGTNASYKDRFKVEIDPTKINTSNFLEVEVWNISESGSFISKKKLVGSGKVNLYELLNNFKNRQKAISVKLSFADKSNNANAGIRTETVEAGVVEFQLYISHPPADTNLRAYKLNISNLCVKNLPAANGDSKTSDPYVHVSLRTMDEAVVIDVGKTTHIQKSKGNETWKETFTTYTIEKDASLIMEIFDWNKINNHESMGFVTLQLSEYLTEPPTTGMLAIKDIDVWNQGRFKGSATLSICLEVEMVKPSEAFRKSISPDFDEALIKVADDGLINRLYEAHYADLRKPKEEVELLRASTSIENKKTILLDSKKGNANKWGVKEHKLVEKIKTSPEIDCCDLVDLEKLLKDADIYMLGSFFKEHGVVVLLSILDRLSPSPDRDLDALIMMQTLQCLKAIMGDTTAVGMEGLLAAQNLMPCIISCLNFEYKALALLAMEMLRLCSVYNPKSSKQAISSALSRSTPSDLAPCFEKLCDGLNRGDIEVKTAVLKLVNSMVYQAAYFKEIKMHNELRNELQRHKFETLVKKAMYTINQESSNLELTSDSSALDSLSICVGHTKGDRHHKQVSFNFQRTSSTEVSEQVSVHLTRSSTSRKSFFSYDSKRSITDNRSESENADSIEQSIVDENSIESKGPVQEITSGFLWVEGQGKWASGLKERHHVLSSNGFHVYHGPDKSNKLKASYPIGSIGKLKEFTSIAAFRDEKRPLFSLLINGKEFAFACNSKEDKDRWVQHLSASIRQYLYKKATSKRNFQIDGDFMTVQKVLNFVAEFGNQYSIYERMMFGNRENIIRKSGVDWDNIYDVSRFLIAEAVASGNNGNLLRIFQQLLLIPVESEGLWAAIPTGLEKLLQICKSNTIPSGDIFDEDFRAINAAFSDVNIKEQLLKKAEEGGEPYAELHDLALFAVRAEKNNEILSRRIKELETEVKKLEEVQGIPETKSYLRPHVEDKEEASVDETEEVQKYKRFENMKKVGLTDTQIRQTMMIGDQFTAEEIDAFLSGTILQAKKNADMDSAEEERQERLNRLEKDLNEARLLPRAAADNLLSVFQDRIHSYEKTFKTSKKDVNAVRKHMQRDHCTKEEENNLCKLLLKSLKPVESSSSSNALSIPISDNGIPDGMEAKPKIRTKFRLQPFYWTKVPSGEIPGTMWHMLQEYQTNEVVGLEDNICEWFSTSAAAKQREAAASKSLPAIENPEKQPETLISLLPSEKNRTVMIVLKQLKLKPDELMELVINLDPARLNESITDSLLGILPVSEELDKAKGFPDPIVLDLTGQFMWHIRRIPNVGERLEFHSTCFTWFSVASTLDEQVAVLNMACATMSAARSKLQKLFSIILGIGNYINGGTKHGQAYGFTVKTLQKLSEYKTKDSLAYGKTTRGSLVDFLVEHIASTNSADILELLDLSEELYALPKAVPISLVEMREDLSKLESGIQQASVELAKIDTGTVFVGLDEAKEARDGPLTNALYQRLGLFVQDSESKMTALRADVAETEKTVNELAAYYGVTESSNANVEEEEKVDRKEPHQKVFGFISDFLHAVKSTYIKAENYRASVRLKERQVRDRANLLMAKRKKSMAPLPPPPPPLQDDERVDTLQADNSTEQSTSTAGVLSLTVPVIADVVGDADGEDDVPEVMTSLRSPRGGALTGDLFDQLNAIDNLNIFADAVGDNYQRILDEAEAEAEAEEVGVKVDTIS